MDVFRFTEIAEAGVPILNPFTSDQLALVGELCRLQPGQSILDLGCGKGELLCTWARDHGIDGIGVDIFDVLVREAEERAAELGVSDRARFVIDDAGLYDPQGIRFDIVACIGAAWVGGSLADTLALMRSHAVDEDPLLLVGEPFSCDGTVDEYGSPTLANLADLFDQLGFDLVEMVMASQEGWDRYAARKWWTAERWLRLHPESHEAPEVRDELERKRHAYLHGGRDSRGWGVFFLRARA